MEGGHLGRKFQVRRYFSFPIARWKLVHIDKLRDFTVSISTLSQQKCYISKGIQPIFENFPSPERCGGWVFVPKIFKGSGILVLQWQGANFCPSTNCEISHFELVHCPSKSSICPKVFNRFSKTFLPGKDVEGGFCAKIFQVHRYFSFAMARWKPLPINKMRNFPLSTCTLSQQKCYNPKSIQPIF